MELLTTIKGTNLTKGRARTWLETNQKNIEQYGFTRINIYFYSDHITIEVQPDGPRKVAGRVKNDNTICVFDICYPTDQRQQMFNGADRLNVFISQGAIRITA